jgi:hypothetical protein
MIEEPHQLRVALQQMGRLLSALADLREQVLSKDPKLFAAMAEAPLEDLERLRQQVEGFLAQLQPMASMSPGDRGRGIGA